MSDNAPGSRVARPSSGDKISRTPGRPAWINRLERVSNALDHLITGTEGEFLAIGRDMTGFYGRAREITQMLASLLGVMSGNEITRTIDGLREMLARIGSDLGGAEDEFTRGVRALEETVRIVDTVRTPLASFKKIVKILKILSISIKIESGQLGRDQAGFVTLANDVEKLSALIETKTANIASKALLLNNIITQNMSKISALETRQKAEVHRILDSIASSLASLAEKNESSREGADLIAKESEEISRRIGDVVSAMQYHDITRQTIEHVKEALDGLTEKLRAREHGGSLELREEDPDAAKLTFEVGKICELQRALLDDSGKQIIGATTRINENLLRIKENIMELSTKTGALAGATDESSSSFLAKIEAGIVPAMSSLKESADARRDLSIAMDGFLATAADMSGSVDDIEEISVEIELIALNAQVKTAHTGEKGAPLGVIAEAIQKLSSDADTQKGAISSTLGDVMATAGDLRSHAHRDMDSRSLETGHMIHDLDQFITTLRSANARITSLLVSIGNSGRGLASDIERTVLGVTVQRTFAEVIDDAMSVLGSILTESRQMTRHPGPEDIDEYLYHLEANYTMQSEREIHHLVVGAGSAFKGKTDAPETALRMPDMPSTREFGDNVELF
jgi:methyl-accepting chemotaxis protein